MASSFYIYPKNGERFPADALRDRLLQFPGVVGDPNDDEGLIVAEDAADAGDMASALRVNPDEPQWIVFVRLTPTEIAFHRDATRKVLERARPVLQAILDSGFDHIEDDESRTIDLGGRDDLSEFLLFS